jgi:hypothetical protein
MSAGRKDSETDDFDARGRRNDLGELLVPLLFEQALMGLGE